MSQRSARRAREEQIRRRRVLKHRRPTTDARKVPAAGHDSRPPAPASPAGRSDLLDLERVTRPDGVGRVERILRTARETLGMQVAYVSQWLGDAYVHHQLDRSDPALFADIYVGARVSIQSTYCKQVVDGLMPPLVADARNDPRSAAFMRDYDPDIGAICSVPLRLSDGRLWGSFCVVGRTPTPI
jgi:GAF domain-containing protein